MKYIFSHTDPYGILPAYVCLGVNAEDQIVLLVRNQGEQKAAEIQLSLETLASLQQAIGNFLQTPTKESHD